jgi:ABC-type sulfate/molybdate transport systems ATPase subunit
MRRGLRFLRVPFFENKCSATHVAADQAFGFKLRIRVSDGSAVHAELHSKFTARRNAVSGAQIPGVYQGAKLVAQLNVERDVAFGLQVHRKHWHSKSGQYKAVLCLIKSQFVFSVLKPAGTTND